MIKKQVVFFLRECCFGLKMTAEVFRFSLPEETYHTHLFSANSYEWNTYHAFGMHWG